MKKQEIFDKVATHLMKQFEVCMGPYGVCAYKADKLRCAIGGLIPAAAYKKDFDGREDSSIGTVGNADIRRAAGIRGADQTTLAINLQHVHDKYSPTEWREELTKVAAGLHLSTAALDRAAKRHKRI